MDWINGLFSIPSALQAVVVISLICTIGLGLGKIKVSAYHDTGKYKPATPQSVLQ